MLLKLVHGEERGTASDQLMAQFGLVVGVLDFVVVILGIV